MEKANPYQLELFAHSNDQDLGKRQISNSFLRYIWVYEKAILITIGLLTTGVVSFCLGVENGKRIMMLKANSHLDIAIKKEAMTSIPVPQVRVNKQRYQPQSNVRDTLSPKTENQPTITREVKEYIEHYTIQIASYRTKVHAQEEAEVLKKKGLSSFVLSKGKFSILCVGSFPKQESARPLLTELQKRYRDCYIRRL